MAGRQSTVIDVSAYEDVEVAGKITVGTTPTANTRIEVWVVGSVDGTIWPDSLGTSDAAKTWTTAGIKYLAARQVATPAGRGLVTWAATGRARRLRARPPFRRSTQASRWLFPINGYVKKLCQLHK